MYLKNEIKYGDIPFFLVKAFKNKILNKHLNKNINKYCGIIKLIKIAKEIKLI